MENENFNSIPLWKDVCTSQRRVVVSSILYKPHSKAGWPQNSQSAIVVSVVAEDPVVGGCEQDYYLALATNVHVVGGWPPEFVVMYVAIASSSS